MSYQVLARKWRPKKFSEVVGQKPVLTALANGLRENRLHHTYLFSGTRGVGKTSIARLFAKGLNCVEGVSAEPCGKCEHCRAIEDGKFIDLIEIDAASRTKVEDTRELLENVQYKPTQGRYKVYLIDEVHMLSRHSFNALLKTLEEPPEYVKFLLATTDPQKLPITILSRCIQFHLKALEQQQISEHLTFVLEQEQIPFDPLAIEKLAKAAQGSIRDSLSLTDQAIAMSNAHITQDIVNTMLGLLDDNQPIEILYALQQGNGELLMRSIQSVANDGGNWNSLLVAISETLHKIAMYQLLPNNQIDDATQLGFLAKHIAPEDVQFFYQIIVSGQKELSFAPTPRIGVEMILLRALAFHPKSLQFDKTVILHDVPQNTIQNEHKLVEMPVVSQNIKAHYQSKTAQSSLSQQTSKENTSNSMLDALDVLDQLSKPITNNEKKNNDVKVDRNTQDIVLPIISESAKNKNVTKSTTSILPETKLNIIDNPPELLQHSENEDDLALAENYRWNWINPEVDKIQDSASPSEIKKAILDNSTPELQEKILTMAREKDKWLDLIEKLNISGLVKQMAMNSFILKQDETHLMLGLTQEFFHLNNEKLCAQLQSALTQFYSKDIILSVELSTDSKYLTPMDYRKQIYQQLSDEARKNLLSDDRLKSFCEEFEGQLELESIRPV